MTGMGTSCGACKFLRRKCTSECIFAPYFSYDQAASHFAAVHKVFGASNVSKLLLHLPVHNRSDAAIAISYEALARMRDPVYGCVADIFALQQQVANLQEEIEILGSHMAYTTVGISSCGGTQSITNPNDELQFLLQHNLLDTNYYPDQPTAMPTYPGYTTGNQVFSNDMNADQLLPLSPWEDLNFLWDSDLETLERLCQGVDQEICAHYQWLDTCGNATDEVCPSCS